MKRTIFILLFAFAVNASFAQVIDSLLAGSWRFTGYGPQNKNIASPDYSEVLTFYSDHIYQAHKTATTPDQQKITFELTISGTWRAEGPFLFYSENHLVPPGELTCYDQLLQIISLSDSTLVLKEQNGSSELYSHYRKIPQQPKVDDDVQMHPEPSHQLYRAYLVNSLDTSKKIWLKPGGDLTVTAIEISRRNGVDSMECRYSGTIVDVGKNALAIKTGDLNRVKFHNGRDSASEQEVFNSKDGQTFYVPRENILDIEYSSPAHSRINTIASWGIFLSATELLVAAPLASIDYKHGGFNKQRYFTMGWIGIAGIAVTIPIAVLTETKTYYLSKTYRGKDWWRLEAK